MFKWENQHTITKCFSWVTPKYQDNNETYRLQVILMFHLLFPNKKQCIFLFLLWHTHTLREIQISPGDQSCGLYYPDALRINPLRNSNSQRLCPHRHANHYEEAKQAKVQDAEDCQWNLFLCEDANAHEFFTGDRHKGSQLLESVHHRQDQLTPLRKKCVSDSYNK